MTERGKSSPLNAGPRTLRGPRGAGWAEGDACRGRYTWAWAPTRRSAQCGGEGVPAMPTPPPLPNLSEIRSRGAQAPSCHASHAAASPANRGARRPAHASPRGSATAAGRRKRRLLWLRGLCAELLRRGGGQGAEVAAGALPASGRPASRLDSQPLRSPPGPAPASACPMSVSLVVIRLELAEHSPVPAGFGFSAAGKSALAALRGAGAWAPGPGGSLSSPSTGPGRAAASGRS